MSKDNGANPALEVTKEFATGKEDEPIVLPNGVRIEILPVSATLLDEMSSRIEDPVVPMWYNEKKDKEEENPLDPGYKKALEEAERKRNVAAFDIMAMFGIELVDGIPEDEQWLKKLQFMQKLGHIDISTYDLDDELEREFVYKRYVVMTARLLGMIGSASGLSAEEVSKAEDTFQSS
jgi:hypothetical protein